MNPADLVTTAMEPAAHGGFSFVQLFLQAHIVVKLVMIGLLLASIWSWAIIFQKLFAFRKAHRESDWFEQQFWSGQSLEELYSSMSRSTPITNAALFVAAMREWKRSTGDENRPSIERNRVGSPSHKRRSSPRPVNP